MKILTRWMIDHARRLHSQLLSRSIVCVCVCICVNVCCWKRIQNEVIKKQIIRKGEVSIMFVISHSSISGGKMYSRMFAIREIFHKRSWGMWTSPATGENSGRGEYWTQFRSISCTWHTELHSVGQGEVNEAEARADAMCSSDRRDTKHRHKFVDKGLFADKLRRERDVVAIFTSGLLSGWKCCGFLTKDTARI